MAKKNRFKRRYFVFPVGDDSNYSVVNFEGVDKDKINYHTECWIKKEKINLPTYEMEEVIFESLKASSIYIYAFVQKKEGGKIKYCHRQGVNKNFETGIAKKIAELVDKIEKIKKRFKKRP